MQQILSRLTPLDNYFVDINSEERGSCLRHSGTVFKTQSPIIYRWMHPINFLSTSGWRKLGATTAERRVILERIASRTKMRITIVLIVLTWGDQDKAVDVDTTVEVDVIADTTQGSSKSSYPLGNHTRSITEKTTQPTLIRCWQITQMLKKKTHRERSRRFWWWI